MPRRVINAFLSAEDKNFYNHPGVDFPSIAAAVYRNLKRLGTDARPVGASTITQQVAKNFLLTNDVSIERKIREAMLAFRMEQAFTKSRILELYLNEIYLGSRSYGVAAAALNYFNKSAGQPDGRGGGVSGALPKAPNNYQIAATRSRHRAPRLGDPAHAGNGVIDRHRRACQGGTDPLPSSGTHRDRRGGLFRRGGPARADRALRRGQRSTAAA